MYTSVLDPFSYIYGSKSLFHIFVCLFAFYMLELGFILCFPCLMPWVCIHMLMHNAIGAKLLQGKWGKSCIGMNMHFNDEMCLFDLLFHV